MHQGNEGVNILRSDFDPRQIVAEQDFRKLGLALQSARLIFGLDLGPSWLSVPYN
jgi:hypothetical protein